ncbi:MAG: GGDEF domain-containing protein [Bacillota bacterium]
MQTIYLAMLALKLAILLGWGYLVFLLARSLRPASGSVYTFRFLAAYLGGSAAAQGLLFLIQDAAHVGVLPEQVGHWPGWVWLEIPLVLTMLMSTALLIRLMHSKRHRVLDRVLGEVRRLRSEVGHDPLTNLCNRATLDQRLAELAGSGEPLSLLFIDVDGFKAYNDCHGHLAGDQVLRSLSALMLRSVRRSDLVARYGGDEFVILLPDAPSDAGRAIAEKLRQQAAEQNHPHRQVTFSIGCAASPSGATDSAALLRMADAAMYRSKRLGGNQVCEFNGPASSGESHTQEGESRT